MFLMRATMTLLLTLLTSTSAYSAATTIFSGVINVNSTWYYADNYQDWATGGAFHGKDLGIITSLTLGGQLQCWETGNVNWSGGSGKMYYRIDGSGNDPFTELILDWYAYSGNNNYFQSGGSTFEDTPIDISGLSAGTHTLSIYFQDGDNNLYLSNNSANYVATFRIVKNPETLADIYTFSTEGTGDSKVYLINDEYELELLAAYVNSGHNASGMTYKLNADITMTQEHTPIGKSSNYFKGTFDGNNKTISNLTINKPEQSNVGLIGWTGDNALIKNVNIVDCNIEGNSFTGGIAGRNDWGKIENCTVTGTIKGTYCVGGIAGWTYARYIKDCFSAATVEGPSYVGSIVGQCDRTSLTANYHSAATTGGVGASGVTTGTDQTGAEVVVEITAGEGVTLQLPTTPSYKWNNKNLYKSGTVVTLDYDLPSGKVFDHYSVSSGEISNAGIKDGTHTLTGFTQNVTITGSYADDIRDIADCAIDIAALTFNGQVQHPLPVVTYRGETLEKDAHYTVTYSEGCINQGTYTVTVTGTGRYSGTKTKDFTINPFDISADGAINVTGIDALYAKTGSAVHPEPDAVTCAATNNATLVAGTDYTLSYSDGCTAPGDYAVTLTGTGNYTGSKVMNFTIFEGNITVHNGSKTNELVPVYGYHADLYQKTEFVMPAEDLRDMSGKVISVMQFYLSSKASAVWNATFQVFMKEVNFTTFDSTNPVYSGTDDATIVYEGSLDGTQNVMTINFTTPYAYQGGNLLIGFYVTTTGNIHPRAYFYGETVTGASIEGQSYISLDDVPRYHRDFLPKTTFWYDPSITLADDATDNSTTISSNINQTVNVALAGRTLYKDGDWNTICLPFDVTIANSPLAGATVKKLISSTSNLTNGTLTLNFEDETTTMKAGTPYIIMWASGSNIVNPVFTDVEVVETMNNMSTSDGKVTFKGNYDYQSFPDENKSILFLGDANTLYWPQSGASIGACRAYFEITDGSPVRAFNLNFGEDEVQGITTTDFSDSTDKADGWYTLDGVKLDKAPNRKGLYIQNGKKVVVK